MLQQKTLDDIHKYHAAKTWTHKRGQKPFQEFTDHTLGTFTYSIITETDGVQTVHYRPFEPCFGELRRYKKGSYRPGDLFDPFPEEIPVALSLRTVNWGWGTKNLEVFTKEGTIWSDVFKDVIYTDGDSLGSSTGFIVQNMDLDSDVLFNFLVTGRSWNTSRLKLCEKLLDKGFTVGDATVAALLFMEDGKGNLLWSVAGGGYSMSPAPIISRLLHNDPILHGRTFSSGHNYRDNESQLVTMWGTSKKPGRSIEINALEEFLNTERGIPYVE